MLTFVGAVFLLPFLATLKIRERLPASNAGYGFLASGLLIAGFAQRHNYGKAVMIVAALLTLAGAVLLVYGWLVRKEIRAFRESLLPK